jgi:osmotically-inducible protein OsmY
LAAIAFALSLTAAASDADVERDIRGRLAKSKISADGFAVHVKNGTAVLTGKTDVVQHKGVATRLAKAGGATKVENRIEISAGARSKASSQLSRARTSAHTGRPPVKQQAPAEAKADELAPPPIRRAVVKH